MVENGNEYDNNNGYTNAGESETELKQFREREEYMRKLKKWLDDARLWHCHISAGYNVRNGTQNSQQVFNMYSNIYRTQWHEYEQNVLHQRFMENFPNPNTPPLIFPSVQPSRQHTYEFVIPPLWKRAVAELIDFFLLFLFKMALTFLILESFDIIDMGFYGFESFQKNLENPEVATPMATELLTLEVFHRLIVCAYEVYFLKGEYYATPGKKYMGLMVVSVDTVSPVPGRLIETIMATGAKPLGWQKSLTRAALKNMFFGLFLPVCVALSRLHHNRTTYDMLSNSVVVEYNHLFLLYNTSA